MAEVESAKAVALRDAELQKEVERMNALTKTEKLKAEFLSKASVEYKKQTGSCTRNKSKQKPFYTKRQNKQRPKKQLQLQNCLPVNKQLMENYTLRRKKQKDSWLQQKLRERT